MLQQHLQLTPETTDEAKPQVLPVGTKCTADDGTAIYKITVSDIVNGTVTYVAPANKKAATVNVPDTVVISGVKYKVTAIEKKAFSGCKTSKKMTVKVPKKKFNAYKRMLKKCGVNKKAKFKKR